MEELTYIGRGYRISNFISKFGKPFYNFSIEIIKIENHECEKEENKSLFYNG
jgi:hypothetical protein